MFKVLWQEVNDEGKTEYLVTYCDNAKDAHEWGKLLAVGGPNKNWRKAYKVTVKKMTEDEIMDRRAQLHGH